MKKLIRPPRLKQNQCIGIFTPSSPLHIGAFSEKFEHGLHVLRQAGFAIKLGSVTARKSGQGYRSASPQDRATEINELFGDPDVHALMSTVGGYNTSSIIDLLDYALIQRNPKIVCGYSDVTSLHCALMTHAGLSSFYGPGVFSSFGEWPMPPEETMQSFLAAVSEPWSGPRDLQRPQRWSRHFRCAMDGSWKSQPRQWQHEEGWNVIQPGNTEAPLFAFNLNTLLSNAGTSSFPNLEGAILLLEDMSAPLAMTERSMAHVARLGLFEKIKGLLWGRIENPDPAATANSYQNIIQEFIPANLPLVMDVDISHTVPMLTIGQGTLCHLTAPEGGRATVTILESMTSS